MGNVSSDSLGVSAGNPLFGGGLNFVTRIWCIEARREEDIEEESDRKWCKRIQVGNEPLFQWFMLKHFESGRVELYVNGRRVGEKFQSAAFKSTHFTVALNQKETVVMTVRFDESAKRVYQYTCAIRPTELAKRDDVESLARALELTEKLPEFNEVKDTRSNPFVVSVDEAVVVQDENASGDSKVVVFRVRTCLKPQATVGSAQEGSETVVVARRFSEFVQLRQTVRSALCGYHLYSDVPNLPPKYNKLLSDHFDPAFIQRRQCGLDSFLKRLVELPRVSSNPELRIFLGYAPALGSNQAPDAEDSENGLMC